MTLNIDDGMLKAEANIAAAKVICEKIKELFRTDYHYKGAGYDAVGKIIDNYIATQEFYDFVIKTILAPTVKEVLHELLKKDIKKYINEGKINNPELFKEEK